MAPEMIGCRSQNDGLRAPGRMSPEYEVPEYEVPD